MRPGMLAVRHELKLVRRDLREGRFDRTMALMTAFAAFVSGWEAYAQHLRGAISHWLMWTPVWPTANGARWPVRGRAPADRPTHPAAAGTRDPGGRPRRLRFSPAGIQRLPGGFQLGQYNVVIGPPIFAPLLMCTVGVLGLLAGTTPSSTITGAGFNADEMLTGSFVTGAVGLRQYQRAKESLPAS